MTGNAYIARLTSPALAAASLSILALVLAAGYAPANAQTLRPTVLTDGPLPPLRTKPLRRPPPGRQREAEPDAQSAPDQAVSGQPAPAQPADVDFDALGVEPESKDGESPPLPLPPTGLRPAARDGAPDVEPGPQAPVDGPADEREDYRNPDGADAVGWDARSQAERATLEQPPAGYDPELYRSDLARPEISPLADRRPERLFRFEPWQQRGIRVGSFIALPQVDMAGAFLSDVFRSKPAKADGAFDLRPVLVLRSDWRTHALELRVAGGLSFLDNYPSEDDRAWSAEARGRLDISRLSSLTGIVVHDVYQETRGTVEQRLHGGPRADVTTDQAGVTFDQRFNRLTISLRGTMTQRSYSDVTASDGTFISNRDRNLSSTEEVARATWAFRPTLQVFSEAAINQRSFDAPSPYDGLYRNSSGERFRFGVGFGNTGSVLRGEASVGWGQQRPDDNRLQAIDGVIVDANLAWRIDADNAVLVQASSDVIDTSTASSGGGLARRGSIEYRHAFLRPLIGTASLAETATTYQGIVLSDRLTEMALGLEYYLAPEAIMFGRYQHQIYRNSVSTNDWDADEIRVGVRLRR